MSLSVLKAAADAENAEARMRVRERRGRRERNFMGERAGSISLACSFSRLVSGRERERLRERE